MSPTGLRATGAALGLLGSMSQLGVAFMGDAIGGPSPIAYIIAVDALVAVAGAVLVARWTTAGVMLIGLAGLGAVIVLFWSTLLEIGVAGLLLGAATAAELSLRATTRLGNQG